MLKTINIESKVEKYLKALENMPKTQSSWEPLFKGSPSGVKQLVSRRLDNHKPFDRGAYIASKFKGVIVSEEKEYQSLGDKMRSPKARLILGVVLACVVLTGLAPML